MALNGKPGRKSYFFGMSSVVSPTSAYLLDAASGAVEPLDDLVRGGAGWRPPVINTERRTASSADGTAVPYFMITRADLGLDSSRPTLLYGYGGFKIPVLADYRAGWGAWLEAGGVVVIANLRGGGEFGTDWYDDGRRGPSSTCSTTSSRSPSTSLDPASRRRLSSPCTGAATAACSSAR